ncbi:alpha/beta fold hydrolase [Calothrix sp. 336/3]|uniref:alpha/beta fold hydrolase n=1 Tax=Calothrix sp. 336/3 TaxID=1337936 RepID=UPI0004E3758F|nr:alpha/beta hydrolase [Calothrix sp. 336/3]AKG20312.1 haloalkane dehalogenase [Calothrix sp. 336/3]
MLPLRQTLSTPDIQLSYLEWNQGKEPLLLLHGMADHALVWSSLGNHLASDYHIIAPDLRGHGESSKPEQGYSFEMAIADLEMLMDTVGFSSAHILSHSWSAKLSTIWARKNPQRFRSLVIVDPIFAWKMSSIFNFTFPFFYRVLPFLQGMGPFASYDIAEAKARTFKQYKDWTPLQQQVFQAGIIEKADGTWVSKFTVAARNGIFEEVMKVPALTVPVTTPTLLIQPEKGVNRFDWQLQPYKKYLKNLQISRVPGNHWAFLTEPEVFNQTVAEFLSKAKSLHN